MNSAKGFLSMMPNWLLKNTIGETANNIDTMNDVFQEKSIRKTKYNKTTVQTLMVAKKISVQYMPIK
jgi:hypothetical protein